MLVLYQSIWFFEEFSELIETSYQNACSLILALMGLLSCTLVAKAFALKESVLNANHHHPALGGGCYSWAESMEKWEAHISPQISTLHSETRNKYPENVTLSLDTHHSICSGVLTIRPTLRATNGDPEPRHHQRPQPLLFQLFPLWAEEGMWENAETLPMVLLDRRGREDVWKKKKRIPPPGSASTLFGIT